MSIIGYTFRAEDYAPDAILTEMLLAGKISFRRLFAIPRDPEDALSELAELFGIDRDDEYSFDSWDFPKRIKSRPTMGS